MLKIFIVLCALETDALNLNKDPQKLHTFGADNATQQILEEGLSERIALSPRNQ